MVHDVAGQLPSNVAFLLIDQDEPESVMRHVLEKVYLPVPMFIDNCEPGQSCQNVGHKLYEQPPDGLPFSRAYVMKVTGPAPPLTTLRVTSVLTGYDPGVVLCNIYKALQ
jgi:hypothetical protein